MLTLTSTVVSVVTSEWKELAAAAIAGYGTARAWFSKEIAAGKAELAKIGTDIKTDASKVIADIKKI